MRISILLISLFACLFANAQVPQRGIFASPLDIPLYLSGNFGELRNNHFHTGLDIKTEGREGLPVYSIADGYVSRIKVSPYGYGLILYINHENGYTSAYAHLSAFNQRISDWIKIKQYERRSWDIDLGVPEGEVPVNKGEIIAYSGNSGGSGGPHLHFEIRETKSELAINPLLFGFPVEDDVKPSIMGIRLYALSDRANVNNQHKASYSAKGKNGEYQLVKKDRIKVYGELGLALHCTDMLSGSANKCGVYSIDVYIDDTLTHSQRMDKLDFDKGRYLNAHVDYPVFRSNKSNIHKCYLEPNNTLPIYPYSPNRGKITIKDQNPHPLRFVVKDLYGNTSTLLDTLWGSGSPGPGITKGQWKWNKAYSLQESTYRIDFPAFNLYKDETVRIKDLGPSADAWSPIIDFGDDDIPVHSGFDISFPIIGVPDSLKAMCFVAQLGANNKVSRFLGKERNGDWLKGRSKSFGRFALAIDQNAPIARSINFTDGSELSANQIMLFTGRDDMSGIDKYDLYIDNTWCLLEYDAKYARFSYKIDPNKILPGNHRLQLVLTDAVGNSRTLEMYFVLRP